MNRGLLACAILMGVTISAGGAGAEDAPAAGVPRPLAEDRAARVSDVRYTLHFVVPERLSEPITGTVRIRFRLRDASRPLALDFAGPSASELGADGVASDPAAAHAASGPAERVASAPTTDRVASAPTTDRVASAFRRKDLSIINEHILIPASALKAGENEIALAFVSSDLALNRSPEFMYTLFVPARARLAFPCFDQPDLKARYSLTLDIPAGWRAVSNGALLPRPDGGQREQVRFAETPPVSTYLFAFAAGRFSIETAIRKGRTFRMFHRETDAQKVARNRDAVFDLHAAALDWLERYTGIAYPFGKFDFLLVPSFQFGGMEHPGSIFYNAAALLLDASATTNQKLGRASLISHETAHMWFGDLVTMQWFDDVWMKEVFANFMAAKIVNPSFPEINHELRFLYAHYPAAYDVDRTPGTNAIRQRLDNLNEAGSLYGAIIYQKAPIVMRQLEMIVGVNGLRDGLREYLKQHAFANATWTDLIDVLDRRTSDDLKAWSRVWVEEAGRPIVRTEGIRLQQTADTVTWRLTQMDPFPSRRLTWSQRLQVTFGTAGRVTSTAVSLQGSQLQLTTGRLPARLLYVLPTGGGIGYGDFVLDAESRAYLLARLQDVPDALTRGAALVTLWEEMLGGRVTPEATFDTIAAALPGEPDDLSVQRMLSYLQQAFWKFLPAAERDRRSPALEQRLRAGLAAAKTSSVKAAWFNALRDTARTSATLEWLETIWRKTATVPGLTLAEPDYMTLALELAVREVPAWSHILEEQQRRIENPDRSAQFEFVRPALSADAAARDAFFESLRNVTNRRRESWVLQGLSYLHHPLRAASAEKHIGPSLELLREIQRTGDIFFPKRWMDATLSGHQSASAARVVSDFLGIVPKEYPERLRRIILSSADDLFRARRLREP